MNTGGYVYILTNYRKTVLYIGVTSNLYRRIYEHIHETIPGFTKKYKAKHLIYYEAYDSILDAIQREKILKGKTRKKKEELINSINPDWEDWSGLLF